jgi:(R,R)-butanediol dehydrogenase / meso-butanediol dehydrogenase / diacetyl reductase
VWSLWSLSESKRQLCEKLGFIGEACDGCFAEEIILPEKLLHRVPAALAPQIAATSEPFAVALHAVRRLRLGKYEPVLVAGCGPIGGFAAVILAHLGFGPILVADQNEKRAKLVARVTAARIVSLDQKHTHDALQGRGIKAAIEATGSIAALHATITCVSGGASIALVGISHGVLEIDPNMLVERELSLLGCHAFQNELPDAIALLPGCATMIAQLIDREITLDEVPDAYARIAAGNADGLKTLIRINASG